MPRAEGVGDDLANGTDAEVLTWTAGALDEIAEVPLGHSEQADAMLSAEITAVADRLRRMAEKASAPADAGGAVEIAADLRAMEAASFALLNERAAGLYEPESPTLTPSVLVGRELEERLHRAAEDHLRMGYDAYAGLLFRSAAMALAAQAREAEGLRAERNEARAFANRWMTAAVYATPVTTMAFDPTSPEAFAESRRHFVDEMLSERDALAARVAELETALTTISVLPNPGRGAQSMAWYALRGEHDLVEGCWCGRRHCARAAETAGGGE